VRITCFLLAFANWLWALFVAFASYMAWGMQCDDGCTSEGWGRTANAPEWTLVLILGVGAWLAATLFLVGPRRFAVRAGAMALELGLVFAGTWLDTTGGVSDSFNWFVPAGAALTGLSALYLRTAYPVKGQSEHVPEVA
jgi:hypothetical protein